MSDSSESKDNKNKMDIEPEKTPSQDINKLEEIMYSIKLGDLNYDESLALAEKYKSEGNTFFQNNKFIEALEKYNQAIDLKVETKNNAVYYASYDVYFRIVLFGGVYALYGGKYAFHNDNKHSLQHNNKEERRDRERPYSFNDI